MKNFKILYTSFCKNSESYCKDSVFILSANDEADARKKFCTKFASFNGLFIKQVKEVI